MTSRSQGRGRSCGGECGYQRLYEGSQASLNDMASKHTHALGRVAALRSGLLHVMKETFATQYTDTERRLGRKLTGEPDAVLLALLQGFAHTQDARAVHTAPAAQPPAGLEDLRAALAARGISVPPSGDLSAWALAVAPATLPDVPDQVRPGPPAQHTAHEEAEPFSPPPPDPAADDLPGLESLFGMEPPAEDAGPPAAPAWDLTHLFDEDPVDVTPAAAARDIDDAVDLVEALYGDSTPEPVAAPAVEVPAPAADACSSPQVSAPREEPPRASARTAASVVKPEMFPAATLPKAPRSGRRTPTKSARVTAAPPAPADTAPEPEVATDRFGELLDIVGRPRPVFMSDLVAASGSPGLVSAWQQHFEDQGTASPVRIITPRGHHRDRGALVVPHSAQLREALAAHGRSCWTECLDEGADRARLRGARLYEAAVVLHRFAEEIVSYKLTANVLSLRLNTPAGLTGVVMWVGSDTPAGPGREFLTEAVADMIGDRMVMLAVLTHETGARAVERLTGLLGEDAAAHGWRPTMPVVASHSWDFASDGGASALAVL